MSHVEGSKDIICPWCDTKQKVKITFQNGDGLILKCGNEKCGNDFFVEIHIEVRFYCSHILDAEFKEDKLEIKDDEDE